jgi:hypothetical protein
VQVERDTIDAVVQRLRPGPYGWRCELPAPVRFFGRPIELLMDTRPVREHEPPPGPAPAEVGLVRLILGGLPGVLAECGRQYRRANIELPRPLGKAHEPAIWVSREWLGDAPPGDWSFVVGISGAAGWGVHSEFSGLEFRRIWSGD